MKSFGLLCCSLLWVITAHAELDTLWSNSFVLSPDIYELNAATLLQNNEVMTAAVAGTEGAVNLLRLSADGEIVWNGTTDLPVQYPYLYCMEQMDEGHLILVGSFQSQDSSSILYVKGISTAGVAIWEQMFDVPILSYIGGARKLADNTVMLYVSSFQFNGSGNGLLIKIDSGGDTLWTRHTNPEGANVQAYDVDELSNGDLVVAGSFTEGTGYYSGYVIRTTPFGVPIWSHTYSSEDNNLNLFCNALDINNNDDILVGGSTGSFWWTSYPWAKSLTDDGDEIWSLSADQNLDGGVVGVRYTLGGGAVMVATTTADFGFSHGKVLTADVDGTASLEFMLDGPQGMFHGLHNSGTRGAIAYGTLTDQNWAYHGYLLRIGPSTTVTGFVRELGSNQPVEGARVELLESGDVTFTDVQGIYSLGVNQTTGTLRVSSPCITPEQRDVTLVEGEQTTENFTVGVPVYLNAVSSLNMIATFGMPERDTIVIENLGNGDLIYSAAVNVQSPTYNWLSAEPASGVVPPGGFANIVVTVLADPGHPEFEFFGEVQVLHNSCPDMVDEVGVYVLALDSPEQPTLVKSFAMHPAYPNPFNNTARVTFDLAQTAQVSAKLFSIDGREAAVLADAHYTAGRHELTIDGDALATGVYILRLTAGAAVATQKIVLLK